MPQYFVGGIIKEYREKNDISQKQLCRGLCSISTLCKIEKGDQNPSSYKLLEALVQRVGAPLSIIDVPLTPTEFERMQLLRKIESFVLHKKYDFKDLLDQYKNLTPSMTDLEKQAYLEGITLYNERLDKISLEEGYKGYLNALQLTFPEYTLSTDISTVVLSMQELNLILFAAIALFKRQHLSEAITEFCKLKNYFNIHNIDKNDKGKIYPILTTYLSNAYGMTGKYIEALQVSNDGIDTSKKEGILVAFADLLYAKGFTLMLMKQKSQGLHIIKQSLALTKIQQRNDAIQLYKLDIIKSFGHAVWNELAME
mgnify:CR=1 FL=1